MAEEQNGGRSGGQSSGGQNGRSRRKDGDGKRGGDQGGRKRNRNRGRGKGAGKGESTHPGKPFTGMLEMIGDKNFGFIRSFDPALPKGDNDPFMPPPLIEKYNLRDGVLLEGTIKPGRKGAWQVSDIDSVMGMPPEEWKELPDFDSGVTIYPNEKLNLVTSPTDVTMRVIDLVAPIGKGQRALIVAPPRTGKTVILKGIARSLEQNHPEVELVALLVDERPEEVTDFKRTTKCTVFASSNDFEEDNHVRVATLAYEYSRRLVEQGKDVVLLLDSLTRLGRTFNLWGGNSGRTMSGGLDARALVMPRKIFGAARNIEHGGSLTIIATALIETGSRMDDVIFEEFKGTGNSELVLDRELADKRIFPAINLRKSGTRNEERLLGDMVKYHHMLMRALNSRHPVEAMQALIRHIQQSPDNIHLFNELIPTEI
ncbi:MAG TPA: transcription termination factor Rho [Polyangiaceae bacterium]|nr:transcription termination factor Rho [Polyangiaceae bacterium]